MLNFWPTKNPPSQWWKIWNIVRLSVSNYIAQAFKLFHSSMYLLFFVQIKWRKFNPSTNGKDHSFTSVYPVIEKYDNNFRQQFSTNSGVNFSFPHPSVTQTLIVGTPTNCEFFYKNHFRRLSFGVGVGNKEKMNQFKTQNIICKRLKNLHQI